MTERANVLIFRTSGAVERNSIPTDISLREIGGKLESNDIVAYEQVFVRKSGPEKFCLIAARDGDYVAEKIIRNSLGGKNYAVCRYGEAGLVTYDIQIGAEDAYVLFSNKCRGKIVVSART